MDDEPALEDLQRAAQGDREQLGALLQRHHARLERVVRLRMDERLKARVDPADVVQSAHVQALRRIHEYVSRPTMPFFLWLRFLVVLELIDLQRKHLGALARDAGREVAAASAGGQTSVQAIAEHVLMSMSTPSRAAVRAERSTALVQALEGMDLIDREVLALRHVEQLSNAETSRELGLSEAAASKRYVRALKRLREALGATFAE